MQAHLNQMQAPRQRDTKPTTHYPTGSEPIQPGPAQRTAAQPLPAPSQMKLGGQLEPPWTPGQDKTQHVSIAPWDGRMWHTKHQQFEGGSEEMGNGSGEINRFSLIKGLIKVLRI